MSNNRFHSLNEYEKLKRKNRRRLVGASALVVLAGLLLAKVLNQSPQDQEQNISIGQTASAVQTASGEAESGVSVSVNNQPASSDDASDLSPSAVLEPAPEGDTQTTELSNPLTQAAQQPAQQPEEAPAPEPVLEPAPEPAAPSQPAATVPAPKPEPKAEKTEPATAPAKPRQEAKPASETAAAPVVVINNRVEPDAQAQAARKAALEKEKKAQEQKIQEQKAAAQRQQQAQQKAALERQQAEQRKKRQAEQEAGRLKAQQAKAEADKKKQQEANRKAAQDALDNKSARTSEKSDPQAILDGKAAASSGGKAVIQAGAYSSREQARQMRQKLADAGVSAYISETETSKGKVYRVRTGSYPSREAANRALAQIRRHGADGIVIGLQ